MYDYSCVLALLRASAVDLQRHALSGEQAKLARMTTERTLRNRARAITHRLQAIPEPRQYQFLAEVVRRL